MPKATQQSSAWGSRLSLSCHTLQFRNGQAVLRAGWGRQVLMGGQGAEAWHRLVQGQRPSQGPASHYPLPFVASDARPGSAPCPTPAG